MVGVGWGSRKQMERKQGMSQPRLLARSVLVQLRLYLLQEVLPAFTPQARLSTSDPKHPCCFPRCSSHCPAVSLVAFWLLCAESTWRPGHCGPLTVPPALCRAHIGAQSVWKA